MEDPDRPGDHACPHTLVTSIPDGIHKHKHTHNVNRWIEANGMSTRTVTPADTSTAAATSPAATLGARLAAASRRAQGLTTAVDDPVVLAGLRGLCAAPRPMRAPVAEKREGPAP